MVRAAIMFGGVTGSKLEVTNLDQVHLHTQRHRDPKPERTIRMVFKAMKASSEAEMFLM